MATSLIRNISAVDIKLIDELARKKKVSREEYLRVLIHSHVATYYETETVNNLNELTQKNIQVIESATNVLNRVAHLIEGDES